MEGYGCRGLGARHANFLGVLAPPVGSSESVAPDGCRTCGRSPSYFGWRSRPSLRISFNVFLFPQFVPAQHRRVIVCESSTKTTCMCGKSCEVIGQVQCLSASHRAGAVQCGHSSRTRQNIIAPCPTCPTCSRTRLTCPTCRAHPDGDIIPLGRVCLFRLQEARSGVYNARTIRIRRCLRQTPVDFGSRSDKGI